MSTTIQNKIQLKRGNAAPGVGILDEGEPGYDLINHQLYIGNGIDKSPTRFLNVEESTDHPGCYYRTVDGEDEWINPPLELSKIYRTSRRYDSKPVYVARISLGQLVKDASKYINFSNVIMTHVVELNIRAFTARKYYQATYIHYADTSTKEIGNSITPMVTYGLNDVNQVLLICVGDWTEFEGEFTIWYTKD